MSLFNVTLVLFLIMDPIGNLTSYLALVKDLDPKRQSWIIFRGYVYRSASHDRV